MAEIQRLDEIPRHWAASQPGQLALVDTTGSHDWKDLEATCERITRLLGKHGVRRGDRVVVVAENGALLVALLFALSRARAWIVNVNARLSAREIDAIREHSGARCVLFLPGNSPAAQAHAQRLGASRINNSPWGELFATAADASVAAEGESDVAALVYTTGTTGNPKGVMLTHGNVLFIAGAAVNLRSLSPVDRIFGVLPMSHVYGLSSVCMGSMLGGACIHVEPRFTPEAMDVALTRDRVTMCQGVPAMYTKYLEYLDIHQRVFSAPALRAIYCGGSPLAASVKAAVEARFGLVLHNGYGLTEAAPTVAQTLFEAPRTDCSVGPALPGVELRVVRDGVDCATNEVGELWVRGPNVMKGYYRDAAATREALRPGGWLATGDLARIAADGATFIEGRLKELIIRSGFNVFPVEVEGVLNSHPQVSQSAVVGRPVEGNEEVVAYVELVPGGTIDAAALLAYAAASLAAYKRPVEIVVMDKLPAAASGKVLKGQLREMARASVAPPPAPAG
ncbi:MAG: AMP-binding protein [Usitatibacter sp.]